MPVFGDQGMAHSSVGEATVWHGWAQSPGCRCEHRCGPQWMLSSKTLSHSSGCP